MESRKKIIQEKIESRENWIRKAYSNIELYLSEIHKLEEELYHCSIEEEIEQDLYNREDRNS
tara:strand:- start:317 stop:502 length:186 start_codon:yes stop_codon:yes gene_type:complete